MVMTRKTTKKAHLHSSPKTTLSTLLRAFHQASLLTKPSLGMWWAVNVNRVVRTDTKAKEEVDETERHMTQRKGSDTAELLKLRRACPSVVTYLSSVPLNRPVFTQSASYHLECVGKSSQSSMCLYVERYISTAYICMRCWTSFCIMFSKQANQENA